MQEAGLCGLCVQFHDAMGALKNNNYGHFSEPLVFLFKGQIEVTVAFLLLSRAS